MTDQQPMPCDRCGQVHARCSAHRRDGLPCTQRPMHGQRVCKMHGGKTPGAVEKAAERQAEAAAEKVVRDLWPGLVNATAVTDPIDLLARTAGVLEQMADVIGERVNELRGKVGGGEHLTQLRAEVVLLDRVLDKVLKASEGLARLGLAERQIEVTAEQVARLTEATQAGMIALALTPADRDVFLRAVFGSLGRELPAVAGEVVA